MTTKVTVETHDWSVRVVQTDTLNATDSVVGTFTIPPRTKRDFHLTSSRSLSFVELPKPEVQPAEAGSPA